MSRKTLRDFRQQQLNANRHTERGMGMLEGSMRKVGYTAPMIAASDGELIAGSARHEKAVEVFGVDAEPLIVESDGTRPIVVVRTDIPDAETRIAKEIALYDNRVQQVDLEFDPNILAQMESETPGLLAGMWSHEEFERLVNSVSAPDFREYDESVADDVEMITCPHCGKEFPK